MTERLDNDMYQTPIETIKSIMPFIDFRGHPSVHEPCKGEGNIYDQINGNICHKSYCEITSDPNSPDEERYGGDYLKTDVFLKSIIITNPPFSLWREFLTKSLMEADTVIYFLRLNVLGSGSKTNRAAFWNANKWTHLFPLEKRPSFTGIGTDRTDYAWFGWDRGNRIKASKGLTVLPAKNNRGKKKSIWVTNKTGTDFEHDDWQDYKQSKNDVLCI